MSDRDPDNPTTDYRVGSHYGIHVYDDDRPVATFHHPDEAARFVAAINQERTPAHDAAVAAKAWDEGFKQGGPMHDVNYDDPDAHTRNPYRKGGSDV